MGMQTAPARLFYDFCLDDHVPKDHLLWVGSAIRPGGR